MTEIEATPPTPVHHPRWNPSADFETWLQHARERAPWPDTWTAFNDVDFTPPADIEETDTVWSIEIELPGMKKKDIDIEARGRTVVISGERKEKKREGVLRQRRRVTGSFRYEVTLPAAFDADAIEAHLEDGELTVTVPKQSHEKPHKVKIA